MQANTIKAQLLNGYYEGGQFYHAGAAVQVPGRFKAMLTIIMDEPQQHGEADTSMDWVDELERIALSATSPTLRTEDFPRMNWGREPLFN